jgi:hypothetical protein
MRALDADAALVLSKQVLKADVVRYGRPEDGRRRV